MDRIDVKLLASLGALVLAMLISAMLTMLIFWLGTDAGQDWTHAKNVVGTVLFYAIARELVGHIMKTGKPA